MNTALQMTADESSSIPDHPHRIKIYAFDGMVHGKFKAGEIHLDGVNPDRINTTTLLHEGVHALHGQQAPRAAKNYSDAEGKPMGDPSTPKGQDLLRWKAYTEYGAYRARFDCYNAGKAEADKKSEDEIHKTTLGDAGVRVPMLQVKQFDPNFDPRVWKPKG